MDVSGIYPALTTPFAADGSVSRSDLKHNIQKYNSTDLAGYVAIGSTGESVMLSRKEMDEVFSTVKEAAAKNKTLIAGTGAESTAETIERTKRAAELGYHVALVKTPFYYKPAYKPEVYLKHYRAVADASPIPIMIYVMPLFTGVTLEAATVAAIAEHPNVIGIKDSGGDVRRIGEMRNQTNSSFQILTGAASVLFPCLAMGACGAIMALASALPEKCVELYKLFSEGQQGKARELQLQLVTASRVMVSELGIAGVKYAMDQRGYRGGVPRLPLQPLEEEQKNRLTRLLEALEPAAVKA
ncbi:MAG TPA: 4-hydroxy-tetrahydrodipicolinate synthase [Candidatus Saccharimonadales bacterium]|nr:4-hydroxy-tetrahydrodipicolinate synthase [Candidatus Saccharimonadales bacterium]